ncbi:hypothetical protein BGW42_008571 [Actinomortierella wolfii]|nr:hypothetical protein BGW42_008571 [Actinomortierella wolfii]
MAAPKVTEQTVNFTPMEGIKFKEITNSSRLQLSDKPLPEGTKDRVNLFVVSNIHGCFAAATDTGFVVDTTERLRREFKEAITDKPHKVDAAINVPIAGSSVRVLRLSADESHLIVVTNTQRILLYSLEALFQHPTETKPFKSINVKKDILDLQPNPSTERNDMAAILFTDQTIRIVSLEGTIISELKDEKFTAMGWSSKGKQIMCGTATGSMIQYTPEGQKKKVHLPPQENQGDRVVSIKWLETAVILAAYCKPEEDDAPVHQYQVSIISKEDKAETIYYNYGDLCFPINIDVRGYTYFVTQSLKNWTDEVNELMVLAATPSSDLGVIGRSKDGAWSNWDLEDTARASVPSSALNSEEVFCVGLTFDLTSKEKLLPLDEEDPEIEPVPVLYVYDNEGFLSAFQLINIEASKNGSKCPCLVDARPFALNPAAAAKSASKTPAKAAPKTTPAPATVASPAPAAAAKGFGSFGTTSTAQTPQFSFGGQNSFGQAAQGRVGGPVTVPSPEPVITPKVIPPAKFKGTSPSEAIAAAQKADERIKITRSAPQVVYEHEEPVINVSPGMAALSQQLENTYVVMKRELAALVSLVDETNALIKSRETLFEEAPLVKTQIETHARSADKIKALNSEVDEGFATLHSELVKTIHKKDEILRLLKDRRDAKANADDDEDDDRGLTPAQTAGLQRMANSLETIEKRLKDLEDYVEALQKKANRIREGLTSRPPALEGIHSSIRNISYALLSKQNDLASLAEELDRLSINQVRLPGEPSELLGASKASTKAKAAAPTSTGASRKTSISISSQALGVSTAPERQNLSRQLRKAALGSQYKVLVNTQVSQQGMSKDLAALPNLPEVEISTTPRRSDQPKKRMTATVPSMGVPAAAAAPVDSLSSSTIPKPSFGMPATGVAPTPSSTVSGFGFGQPKDTTTLSFGQPAVPAATAAPLSFGMASSAKIPAAGSTFAVAAGGFGTTTALGSSGASKPMFGGFNVPAANATPATSKPLFEGFAKTPAPAASISTPAATTGGFAGFSFAKPQSATADTPAVTAKPTTSLFGSSTMFSATPAATGTAASGGAPKPPSFPGFAPPAKEEEKQVPEDENQEGEEEEEVYDDQEYEGGEEGEEYDEQDYDEGDYGEGEEYDEDFDEEAEYEAYLQQQDQHGSDAVTDEEGGEEEEEKERGGKAEEKQDQEKPTVFKSAFGAPSSQSVTSTSSWAAPSYSFPAPKSAFGGLSGATTTSSTSTTTTTTKSAFPTVSAPMSFGTTSWTTTSTTTASSSPSASTVTNTSGSVFGGFGGGFGGSSKSSASPFATFAEGKKNIFVDLLKKSDEAAPQAKEAKEKDEDESKASKESKEPEPAESKVSGDEENKEDKDKEETLQRAKEEKQEEQEDKEPVKPETTTTEKVDAKPVEQEEEEEEEEEDESLAAAPPSKAQDEEEEQEEEEEEVDESEKETVKTESSAATARPALRKEVSAGSEESFNLVEKPTESTKDVEESEEEEQEEEKEEEEKEEPIETPPTAPVASGRVMAADSDEDEDEDIEEEADNLSPALTAKKPVPGLSPADSEAEDDDISSTASELLPPVSATSLSAGGAASGAGEKDETASLFSSWGGISGGSSSFGSSTATPSVSSAGWGFGSTSMATSTATSTSIAPTSTSTAWGGFGTSTPSSSTTTAAPVSSEKPAWGSGTATFGQSSGFGSTPAATTTTTSAFGSGGSAFGQTSTLGTGGSAFGQTSALGTGGSAFGQSSTLGTGGSAFGQTSSLGTGGSAFGQTSTLGTGGSAFGQTSTLGTGGSAFGQTSALGTGGSAFGQTSTLGTGGSGFGQTSTLGSGGTAFGQTSTLGVGFGQTSTLGSGFGKSAFGSAASSTTTSSAPQSNFGAFASSGNAFAALAQQGGKSAFDQGGGTVDWTTDSSSSGSVFGSGGGSSVFGESGFGTFGQQQGQTSAWGSSNTNTTWGASANNNNNSTWGASNNKSKSTFTQFR